MIDPAVPIAVQFVIPFEGFKSAPYDDGFGNWTVGYGTTILSDGSHVTEETPAMSEAEARSYLTAVMSNVVAGIRRLSSLHAMTANQCAACASLAYNVGMGNFSASTLLKNWNKGSTAAAAAQFPVWDLVNGKPVAAIERRRLAEQKLFLKA